MSMTKDHKRAIILLSIIVALYPWAMNNHSKHDPKSMADLPVEFIEIEDSNGSVPKQNYDDATKPGPHSGGYDPWKSSIISDENTEN